MPPGQAARPEKPLAPAPRQLLHDPRPEVRLRSALALARKQDVEAIPVLIDLLAEVPPARRQGIEEVLREWAGPWAPNLTLAGDDDVSRGIRRDAWASWWRRTAGPALLEELRKRTLSAAELEKVRGLLRQLGDRSYRVREKAMTDLVAHGPAVVPLLRTALKGADLEQRRRAVRCLEEITRNDTRPLPPVAARLLAIRKPEGAAAALLAFYPWTEDEALAGEVQKALTTLAVSEGRVDPALLGALEDPLPLRRALAVEVLSAAGAAGHQDAVRKLLADPHPAVRLCAAVARVQARDRDAVPVLIDLATDLPPGPAWHAQEVLRRLAGDKAPQMVRGDKEADRQQFRAAWKGWWKEHAGTVKLAPLETAPIRKAHVSARASSSWKADTTPDQAFDRDRTTMWSSGNYAPQWLEADLGAPTPLAGLSLTVSQTPAGPTTHEIWVSDEPIGDNLAKARRAHTFTGATDNTQVLEHTFPQGVVARYVQIRTTESPSWVAWVEVELRVPRNRLSFVK
jgi:HEAT repeat protein